MGVTLYFVLRQPNNSAQGIKLMMELEYSKGENK